MGIEMFDPYEQFEGVEDGEDNPELKPTDEKLADEATKLKQNENPEDDLDRDGEEELTKELEKLYKDKETEERQKMNEEGFPDAFKELEVAVIETKENNQFEQEAYDNFTGYGPDGMYIPNENNEGQNTNLA